VDLRIPVRLTLQGESVETTTVLVSRHGAMVRYPSTLPVGTRLLLRHHPSGQETVVRVVWSWPDGESDGFKLGLEMVEIATAFWGDAYERLSDQVTAG
jgi:hypothetical protein